MEWGQGKRRVLPTGSECRLLERLCAYRMPDALLGHLPSQRFQHDRHRIVFRVLEINQAAQDEVFGSLRIFSFIKVSRVSVRMACL